jgi:hypothetical protein
MGARTIINDAFEYISPQNAGLRDCKSNTATGVSLLYIFIYGNAPLLLPVPLIPKNSGVILHKIFK